MPVGVRNREEWRSRNGPEAMDDHMSRQPYHMAIRLCNLTSAAGFATHSQLLQYLRTSIIRVWQPSCHATVSPSNGEQQYECFRWV